MTRRGKIALAVLAACTLGVGAWFSGLNEYVLKDQMLASILGLRSLPPSVSDVHCKSVSWTDRLWTCAFSVDPSEFEALFAGESFEEGQTRWPNAHDFPMALKLGPNFPVAHYFRAVPGSYSGGGEIVVLASSDESRVVAHLYIE